MEPAHLPDKPADNEISGTFAPLVASKEDWAELLKDYSSHSVSFKNFIAKLHEYWSRDTEPEKQLRHIKAIFTAYYGLATINGWDTKSFMDTHHSMPDVCPYPKGYSRYFEYIENPFLIQSAARFLVAPAPGGSE